MSGDGPGLDPVAWARRLHEWGSEDVVFDLLMALGPVVVLAMLLGDRGVVPTALATLYVVGFVAALVRNVLGADED